MCGITAIYSSKPVDKALVSNIDKLLEHRGHDNTGFVTLNGDEFYILKSDDISESLKCKDFVFGKQIGLAVRYRTNGTVNPDKIAYDWTPGVFEGKHNLVDLELFIRADDSTVVLLNGEARTGWVDDFLKPKGYDFIASNDTARLAGLIQYLVSDKDLNLLQATKKVLANVEGAYSISVYHGEEFVVGRGSLGFRPLERYKMTSNGEELFLYPSESQIIGLFDPGYVLHKALKTGDFYSNSDGWRCMYAGELDYFGPDGFIGFDSVRRVSEQLSQPFVREKLSQCIFDPIYFASPSGFIFGIPPMKFRGRCGTYLSPVNYPVVDNPKDDLIVVPVPDSGRSAADGYASHYGYKKREGLIKNPKIPRTFIAPGQELREWLAARKYQHASYVYSRLDGDLGGNEIIFIDDSLVRGTTAPFILRGALANGAKKVHFKLASPPIISACYYGIDIKHENENDFFARGLSEDEILEKLIYQTNKRIDWWNDQPNVKSIDARASKINIALEYLKLEDLVKCANGFYARSYIHNKFPEMKKFFVEQVVKDLESLLTKDHLIYRHDLKEAKYLVSNKFIDLMSGVGFKTSAHVAGHVFDKLTQESWCLSCFVEDSYATCVKNCDSCNNCAKLFNE